MRQWWVKAPGVLAAERLLEMALDEAESLCVTATRFQSSCFANCAPSPANANDP